MAVSKKRKRGTVTFETKDGRKVTFKTSRSKKRKKR